MIENGIPIQNVDHQIQGKKNLNDLKRSDKFKYEKLHQAIGPKA
jgi:hypothetical protein